MLVRLLLQDGGVEVTVAPNGYVALERVAEARFKVIVLDLKYAARFARVRRRGAVGGAVPRVMIPPDGEGHPTAQSVPRPLRLEWR